VENGVLSSKLGSLLGRLTGVINLEGSKLAGLKEAAKFKGLVN